MAPSNFKIHDVGGVNIALTEIDGLNFSKFLTQMEEVPNLPSMITTDENGFIVAFEPQNGTSWSFVFFIQNLMITQRLHLMDTLLKKEGLIK